jgi:hypothetical protein
MQLLRTYQKGTVLFNAPDADGVRGDLPGIPWAVHVYYDAPVSSPVPAVNNVASVSAVAVPVCADMAVESHPLTMYFKGTVAGLDANVLIDSGASEQCVSRSFVERNKLHVAAVPANVVTTVTLADGRTDQVGGQCRLTIKIGCHTEQVLCWVLNLTDQFDVILGDAWLLRHKAYLDYSTKSCVLRKHGKRVVIQNKQPASQPVARSPVLSAMQFKREVKRATHTDQ